jgi:hypothetical protein
MHQLYATLHLLLKSTLPPEMHNRHKRYTIVKMRMGTLRNGDYFKMRSFTIYTLHLILLERLKQEGLDGHNMQHKWGNKKCIQNFSWKISKENISWETKAQMVGQY